MKKITRYLTSFVIGVGIGNLVELLISMFVGNLVVGAPEFIKSQPSILQAKIIETIFYGGFGLVASLTSEFINYPNLFKSSLIQLSTIIIYFLITGYYLKWFTNISSMVFAGLSFLVVYIIIWFVVYQLEKLKVEQINKKLKELRGE